MMKIVLHIFSSHGIMGNKFRNGRLSAANFFSVVQ
jgi:hypothetical protein